MVEPVLVALVGAVDAAVPHDHFARAVLAGRDHALERGVVEGMVLGLRREALFARIECRSLGNGPGLEHAVAFQAQIVVQAPRGMLLDDEEKRATALGDGRRRGLRRGAEAALCAVLGELVLGHGRDFMKLLAGASGYSFTEWKGPFYP